MTKQYVNPKTGALVSRQRWDQLQNPGPHSARQAISYRIKKGEIPPAKTLPCFDCGAPAQAYDHFLGYEVEHRLDVQPVCTRCHGAREMSRSGACRRGHERNQANAFLTAKGVVCRLCRDRSMGTRRGRLPGSIQKHVAVILTEDELRAVRGLILIGFGGAFGSVVRNALREAFDARREQIAEAGAALGNPI